MTLQNRDLQGDLENQGPRLLRGLELKVNSPKITAKHIQRPREAGEGKQQPCVCVCVRARTRAHAPMYVHMCAYMPVVTFACQEVDGVCVHACMQEYMNKCMYVLGPRGGF